MASPVEICNLALGHIGSKNYIKSLDERSVEAEQCALFYSAAREAVLEAKDWPFATKTEALALHGEPPSDWRYQYAMPRDCLRTREIVKDPAEQLPVPYARAVRDDLAARLIHTNRDKAVLRYTANVEASGLFTPGFAIALSFQLAVFIAMPLTRDQKIAQQVSTLYADSLTKAAESDRNAEHDEPGFPNQWLEARN